MKCLEMEVVMKKQTVIIVLSVLTVLFIVTVYIIYNTNYRKYKSEGYLEFFDQNILKEVNHIPNENEKEIATHVLNDALLISEGKNDARNSLLVKLWGRNGAGEKIASNSKVITCLIKGETGHLWLNLSEYRIDKDGNEIIVSKSILSMWEIEKQGEKWIVKEIHQRP